MQQPLFIHSDPQFVARMRSEAGPHALITNSVEQAIRWIQSSEVRISAVYLNPNHPGQSTFGLLELTLRERPVTPIFFIDKNQELAVSAHPHLLESVHVQKLFHGDESFFQMIESLNVEVHPTLQDIKKRLTTQSEHEGYLAVPLIDFVHSKQYPFDVFLDDETKTLRLFATAGSPIEVEYLSHVAQKTSWLYVSEASIDEVRKSIRTVASNHREDPHFPQAWKTAEALARAKSILKNLQKQGSANDRLVEETHTVLGDIFQIISHLGEESKLQEFIDQAKECDRNIACASLAILMSKALKFEKNAIVEILGLASFFQDISLYQSPFGNLSELRKEEMNPEAAHYFLYHSVHSADILAKHTSVPEVTLQVMRQHHERKDRTGFPNRIGGMQLHPMAEVLSMINAYLDCSLTSNQLERDVYSHYSDRMVAAFKTIVPQKKISERIAA